MAMNRPNKLEYIETISGFLRVFAPRGEHGDADSLRLIFLEKSAQELAAIFNDGPGHLQHLQPDLVSLGQLLQYINDPPRTFGALEERISLLVQAQAGGGNPAVGE